MNSIELQKRNAIARGLPEEEVETLWEAHVRWCTDTGRIERGGSAWQRLVDMRIEQLKDQKSLTDRESKWAEERSKRLEAERRAKDLADAEYELTAVCLKDWLGDLRTREDFSEAITPLEAHVGSFRDPLPGEDTADWLMAAVKSAPKVARNRDCACGKPVASWVSQGRRYYAGMCMACRKAGK